MRLAVRILEAGDGKMRGRNRRRTRYLGCGSASAALLLEVPWPSGTATARHLLAHPSLVAGRRVLDLGCGVGAAGLAAGLAGAKVRRLETSRVESRKRAANAVRS